MVPERWSYLIPRPIREFPIDLAVVMVWVVLTDLVVLGGIARASPLRIVLGVPFVLFIPGYALTAALLPGREVVGTVERITLAIGTSVAAVPLVGLGLDFSPWPLRPGPVILAMSIMTLVLTAVAAIRRLALSTDDRYTPPLDPWARAAHRAFFDSMAPRERLLNVALAAAIVLAVVALGGAVAGSGNGESFTELSLLSQSESDDLVAEGYPRTLAPGETGEVIVSVGNHEGETITYAVVVLAEPLSPSGDLGRPTELDRLEVTVPPGETRQISHTFTLPSSDSVQRVSYLLYLGDAPSDPTRDGAYRAVHLWIQSESG